MITKKNRSILPRKAILMRAVRDSFVKLLPKTQLQNPVIFLVYCSAIFTTGLLLISLFVIRDASLGFIAAISCGLWATVLASHFVKAVAEGRGKGQADALRATKKDINCRKIHSLLQREKVSYIPSTQLKRGELVLVMAGEQIPADGDVVDGAASVDESAITGESAPVIRESGGVRSAVTGGTTVISDWLVIEISREAEESFLNQMIAMVEGAKREPPPKERSLQMILTVWSVVAFLMILFFYVFFTFFSKQAGIEHPIAMVFFPALLVCIVPTTMGALLSAIGIAGMSRLNCANVLALDGQALETAGDIDILMLEKTGTITLGNRQAAAFVAVDGADEKELADAAQLCSLADETPEGRSVVVLAKELFGIRGRNMSELNMEFVPFTVETRMSGVNIGKGEIRKGAADSIKSYVEEHGGKYSKACDEAVKQVANQGGTPLIVAKDYRILGVIYLKDIVKQGVQEKFAALRKIGMKTMMITGDNPLTAAAIAAEAGVDGFLAEATPDGKLAMIRKFQEEGHLVAMTGESASDAPALAQADVAVAMNIGTQVVKDAGNMVDLDSSPTKLIDIVGIGKQLLNTRRSLTIFSVTNDLTKSLAIIPVLLMGVYPSFKALNFMGLYSAQSAILAVVIYNVLLIVALIPMTLRGVHYPVDSKRKIWKRNLLVYGIGGILVPLIAVKFIDMLLAAIGVL